MNIWVSIDAAHDHSTISAMRLPRSIAILAMRKPAIQSKALENPGSAQKVAQGDELLLRGSHTTSPLWRSWRRAAAAAQRHPRHLSAARGGAAVTAWAVARAAAWAVQARERGCGADAEA